MKRRFTDCDMWEGDWFMSLPLDMKLLWRYLCDRCDNAGRNGRQTKIQWVA